MEIIRIGAAGIACVLAAIFMKTAKPEYSVYLTMAAGLFILAFAVGKFSYLYESLKRFHTVFPACGSSNSAIELTMEELEEYSGTGEWVDVCKGWGMDEKSALGQAM